ncbi:hypothetical protein SVAN01_03568 [Stagonosporopsis vannaccii]|nr:hypothetical protein SVAN01_03568 [Stagonosporopsis vannaccii]
MLGLQIDVESMILDYGRDYLRHTRTLVIEHQEIANPRNGFALEDPYKSNETTVKLAEDLGLVTLMAVLQLFPSDVLQDFRFVSSRCIPLMVLQHLSLEQRLITTIHSSYVDEPIPNNSLWPLELFYSIRHLDLQVHWQPSILGKFFRRLVSNSNTMESLCLTADLYQNGCEEVYYQLSDATLAFESITPPRVLPRLKELALCGFDMKLPWLPVLRKFIDFSRLTSLYVTKCGSASRFFADLGSDTAINQFRLKHFAADCLTENSDYERAEGTKTVPLDRCLAKVFQKSGKLESLHVGWHEHWMEEGRAKNLIQTTVDKACSDGKSLRILAVHPHNEIENEYEVDSLGENLGRLCSSCPHLQQLAYQLGYGVLDDCLNSDEADKALDDFVNQITRLRDLRTLHLRYPHELEVSCFSPNSFDKEDVDFYLRDLARTMRYIASEIFLKLDKFQADTGLCHRLHTIVIGHLTPLRQYNGNSLPQHCFIKTERKGVGDDMPSDCVSHTAPGERKYRAVMVDRARLRQLRAHTEVLDWDVGVQPFEQWAGRAL